MENLAPGRCVCVAEQPRGRAFVHGLGEQRPDVCRPGSPRSPLATRTLLLDSDHAVVPLSPLVLNNALLSPGRTPRKLQGSAVRIPVNHAPAVQPHDAPPATGSVMALAQVKTPKRCGNSPFRPLPSGRLGRQLWSPVAVLTPCAPTAWPPTWAARWLSRLCGAAPGWA